MLIGYARASAADETLKRQTGALGGARCERIFSRKAECGQAGREGLADELSHLRPGNELVFFKLDRLDRTIRPLIKLVDELRRRDAGFRSLTDGVDRATTSSVLTRSSNRTTNVSEVAVRLGVVRSTLYRAIERASASRVE